VKVTASGGAYKTPYFGLYYLDVGCTATSVVYGDNGALSTSTAITVGQTTVDVYTFAQPTSTKSYCVPVTNYIVNNDATGTTLSGQT